MEALNRSLRSIPILLCLLLTGCATFQPVSFWLEGGKGSIIDPLTISKARLINLKANLRSPHLPNLDSAWAAYHSGKRLEIVGDETAVDQYYLAAKTSRCLIARIDLRDPASQDIFEAAQLLYHESLRRFLRLAHNHNRVQGGKGIRICLDNITRCIPLLAHDFPWQITDFNDWRVVGQYASRDITASKIGAGVGVPLVVIRQRCQAPLNAMCAFLPNQITFPATAQMSADGMTLELFNPLLLNQVEIDGFLQPLAKDLTADIAYQQQFHEDSRLAGFFNPSPTDRDGKLIFLEPFQPEKIPIVFVHGLLSSPAAWSDVYNELRSDPNIRKTYQFWAFQYSTGEPFIKSAQELRRELNEAFACYSNLDVHQNMTRTILIGHSMGGLISKVLISESGSKVWQAIANVPLDELHATRTVKQQLSERFFFSPHPLVSRVVYIAAPHEGSEMAGRLLGRVASASVRQEDETYQTLLRNNPGAFKSSVTGGLPTSIDMLDPEQPFLDLLANLPQNNCAVTHTILGNGCRTLSLAPSDGVVSVQSARQKSSVSEKQIPSTHNGLLRNKESFAELNRILKQHAGILNENPLPGVGSADDILFRPRSPVE